MKQILVYDINSFPESEDLDEEKVIEIYNNLKIVIWDSSFGGIKPDVLNVKDHITLIDISQLSKEQLKEFLKDK